MSVEQILALARQRPILIIACSEKKNQAPPGDVLLGHEIYKGRAWQVYRAWRGALAGPDGPLGRRDFVWPVEVWAMSGKFGLVPELAAIPDYNQRVPTDDPAYRSLLASQVTRLRPSWAGRPIVFVGSKVYAKELRHAKLQFEQLSWRCGSGGAGWGCLGQNLARWLEGQARR